MESIQQTEKKPQEGKKKSFRSIINLIVFLGAGIGLVIWKYNDLSEYDKSEMFKSFQNIQWLWFIPIVIVGFFSHFFRAMRWRQLLEPLDVHPSRTNITLAVLIGYLGNTIIPRFGEVLKCSILARYENVAVDKLVGTIIAERAFDVVCLLLIFALTLSIEFTTILPFAHENIISRLSTINWWKILIFLIVSVVVFIIIMKWLLPKLRNSKVGQFIKGIGDGLKSIFKIKKVGWFIVNSLMIWVCYTTMSYIGFLAIPGLGHLDFMAALSVIAFGSIAMILTPGGIGVYPVIITQLLTLYGISEGLGMAYGWVSWGAQTIVVVILGLLSLILLPIVNRKKQYNG